MLKEHFNIAEKKLKRLIKMAKAKKISKKQAIVELLKAKAPELYENEPRGGLVDGKVEQLAEELDKL